MATFPLSVSANGRYLVDALGVPFLMVGDSPQGLLVAISAADAATYIANREAKGFNTIQVHLIANDAFGGSGNLATFAGLTPFTSGTDFATPRTAYFNYVEDIIDLAADAGMVVMLTAGHYYGGLIDLYTANGNTKCNNFGQYLGTRFGAKTNIIWDHGNDVQDTNYNSAAHVALRNVASGIRTTAPSHLQTVWLDFPVSASRDSSAWNALIDVDFCYTYAATYTRCLNSYALSPAKPVFFGEGGYEDESIYYSGTPLAMRKQAWWAMTAGACGQFYCNIDIWNFKSGWASRLNDYTTYPALQQMGYLKDFFSALSWWLLVPDTNSSHTVMTAGYGTYVSTEDTTAVPNNTYATCARASDGTCIVAYIPAASRQVTIDMTKIAGGLAHCRWFNPRTGAYTEIGSYNTTGTRDFTTPSGSGDTVDAVLLLEGSGAPIGTPVLSVR